MREFVNLIESFAYITLLTEATRSEFLLMTYGAKLNAFWDRHAKIEPRNIVAAIEDTLGDDAATKILNFLLAKDPSPSKNYGQWMVSRVLSGGLKLEDIERATTALRIFDRARSRIEKKDIQQYPTLQTLEAVVEPFATNEVALSTKQEKKSKAAFMSQPNNSTTIYNDNQVKVVIPHNEAASCYFGVNTKWCTTSTETHNYFNDFNKNGPLYIIIDKANNRRWQWHFESRSFNDERDAPSSMRDLLVKFPQLREVFGEKLIPFVRDIGLSLLSPEAAEKFLSGARFYKVVHAIHNKKDAELVPQKFLKDTAFIIDLIQNNDDDYVKDLIAKNPSLIKHIPEKYRS